MGMWRRARQARTRVEARVISYGNITAGGTGKTPAVIARVREELALGHKVAVLTRGYGSPPARTPQVLRGSALPPGAALRFGDEPTLIARKAPEAFVIKCTDRVAAARYAVDVLGCDTLILDDGFQYLRLHRDENIVLIDATNPFGGGHLLPRGLLREPLDGLARATEFVLTRCDQSANLAAIEENLRLWNHAAPMRRTWHAPTGVWRISDGATVPLEELQGRTIHAACAIGNPDAFAQTLQQAGAIIASLRCAPDHVSLDPDALTSTDEQWVVVTEKDAVRMDHPPSQVYALAVELQEYAS
jgi:tetraacyldisaccharide 4'-kinase